jgi:hypothetical protein
VTGSRSAKGQRSCDEDVLKVHCDRLYV